jgi:hypothetical protein
MCQIVVVEKFLPASCGFTLDCGRPFVLLVVCFIRSGGLFAGRSSFVVCAFVCQHWISQTLPTCGNIYSASKNISCDIKTSRVREKRGEDPGVDGWIILRWIFRKWDVGAWTGSVWLRIGTGGGHLWMRKWIFGFHKIWGISWIAESRLAYSRRTLLHGVSK